MRTSSEVLLRRVSCPNLVRTFLALEKIYIYIFSTLLPTRSSRSAKLVVFNTIASHKNYAPACPKVGLEA
jgi:hypothetical protein